MIAGNGQFPTQDEVTTWTNQFGLTHPVAADPGSSQAPFVLTGFPTYVVIDRSMTIVNADMWPWSDNTILQHL